MTKKKYPKTIQIIYHGDHQVTEIPYFAKFESSSLAEGLYNELNETLVITFQSGVRYFYKGVPVETWIGLLKAESKGAFFSSEIRSKFEFEKLSGSGEDSN